MHETGQSAQGCTLRPDAWLSGILGYPAWRVEAGHAGSPQSALQEGGPVFAYAKVDAGRIAEVSRLTASGFRVVDTALGFDGPVPDDAGDAGGIRFAAAGDRNSVSRIAASAFRYSRFHLDPLIPGGTADAIKSAWAANFFSGQRGDGMVVAERGGQVVGFLQLLWAAPGRLVIDLIGVEAAAQSKGIGREMIAYAARHGTGDDRIPQTMAVGTQAANVPSVRLYESLGLRLASAQYVLHYHGPAAVVQ